MNTEVDEETAEEEPISGEKCEENRPRIMTQAIVNKSQEKLKEQ